MGRRRWLALVVPALCSCHGETAPVTPTPGSRADIMQQALELVPSVFNGQNGPIVQVELDCTEDRCDADTNAVIRRFAAA